ncbi:two component transcriptional regulator, LuxR family [Desulfuromonas acetoxidans DSM 684]|uniref:Two component transcriptional regulator, LuxR family n=1 Tax=Desulfuromonas acetoxidans (strain DSM 684 / 11070) TaxID=281689 RepID=Q1K3E5_DESA6|nr:response regulator transcription factor [Desulfuromonas acetoxidans]EAT17029.1 two component transcriptional regulator, LuxR family [Desulfuromonas acetoxidans DSM 684]
MRFLPLFEVAKCYNRNIGYFSREKVHFREYFIVTLQVLIVAEFPVVEEGLDYLLRDYPDIEVVATASNGVEGLEQLRKTPIDIVVHDLCSVELGGPEAITLYLEEKPQLGVIEYSSQSDEVAVFESLKAGARGYVLKSSSIDELVNAIREVHQGGYFISAELNPAIIQFYLDHRENASDQLSEYQLLTDREKQVFRLLANGKQTHEISEILCISPKTVAKHRAAVKKKLSLNTTAEMAKYAIQIGVINLPSNEAPSPTHIKSS